MKNTSFPDRRVPPDHGYDTTQRGKNNLPGFLRLEVMYRAADCKIVLHDQGRAVQQIAHPLFRGPPHRPPALRRHLHPGGGGEGPGITVIEPPVRPPAAGGEHHQPSLSDRTSRPASIRESYGSPSRLDRVGRMSTWQHTLSTGTGWVMLARPQDQGVFIYVKVDGRLVQGLDGVGAAELLPGQFLQHVDVEIGDVVPVTAISVGPACPPPPACPAGILKPGPPPSPWPHSSG